MSQKRQTKKDRILQKNRKNLGQSLHQQFGDFYEESNQSNIYQTQIHAWKNPKLSSSTYQVKNKNLSIGKEDPSKSQFFSKQIRVMKRPNNKIKFEEDSQLKRRRSLSRSKIKQTRQKTKNMFDELELRKDEGTKIEKQQQMRRRVLTQQSELQNSKNNSPKKQVPSDSESITSDLKIQSQSRVFINLIPSETDDTQFSELVEPQNKVLKVLDKNTFVLWVFVIPDSSELREYQKVEQRVMKLYNYRVDRNNIFLLLKDIEEFQTIAFSLKNDLFKIVCDFSSAQKLVRQSQHIERVLQIHIYDEKDEVEPIQITELTKNTSSLRRVFSTWEQVLHKAEQQVQDYLKIFNPLGPSGQYFAEGRSKLKVFPNFMSLGEACSKAVRTQTVNNRINLYGAENQVGEEQKQQNRRLFIEFCKQRYKDSQQQLENIAIYEKHSQLKINSPQSASMVMALYKKQSFYYDVINGMLRTAKSVEQFEPCVWPFYEMNCAIQILFKKYLSSDLIKNHDKDWYEIPETQLYRAGHVKKSQLEKMKRHPYIETLGFFSCSKSRLNQGHTLFHIHMKKRKIKKQNLKFEPGFVYINHDICKRDVLQKILGSETDDYLKQDEVILNASTILKVNKVIESTIENFDYEVFLQAYAIDSLQNEAYKTQEEQNILYDITHCRNLKKNIKNRGDVYRFSFRYDKAERYYEKLVNQSDEKSLLRADLKTTLSNIQKQLGKCKQSENCLKQAKEIYEEHMNLKNKEICLKILAIHSKLTERNIQSENFLSAQSYSIESLSILRQDQIYQRAVKLREIGTIKFENGQVSQAITFLQNCKKQIDSFQKYIKEKRSEAKWRYYRQLFQFIILCGSTASFEEIEERKEKQLQEAQTFKQQIEEIRHQIKKESLKIEQCLKQVSIYVGDKQKQIQCEKNIKKAKSILIEDLKKTSGESQRAELLLEQAQLLEDLQDESKAERLMVEALEIIESRDQNDEKISEISQKIANSYQQSLQRQNSRFLPDKPSHVQIYDFEKKKQCVAKCKKYRMKAVQVLLHHSGGRITGEISSVKNSQLEMELALTADTSSIQQTINSMRYERVRDNLIHSQVARTYLIEAKLCAIRGQLRVRQETLKIAEEKLYQALVEQHVIEQNSTKREQYEEILQQRDLFLQICINKADNFMEMQRFVEAKAQCEKIIGLIKNKMGDQMNHPLSCDVLELLAKTNVRYTKNSMNLQLYFEQSLEIRCKQVGKYHPLHAKSCSQYAQQLFAMNEYSLGVKYLKRSKEVISWTEKANNPNYLSLMFVGGIQNGKMGHMKKAERDFKFCVDLCKTYFDETNTQRLLIQLFHWKCLNQMIGRQIQSLEVFRELFKGVKTGLQTSNEKSNVKTCNDDKKLKIAIQMYEEMQRLFRLREKRKQIIIGGIQRGHWEALYKQAIQPYVKLTKSHS